MLAWAILVDTEVTLGGDRMWKERGYCKIGDRIFN